MIWFILESRCTANSKAFKTRDAAWDEISHNDREIKVIDFEQYKLAENLLAEVLVWRSNPDNDAFPHDLRTKIQNLLDRK